MLGRVETRVAGWLFVLQRQCVVHRITHCVLLMVTLRDCDNDVRVKLFTSIFGFGVERTLRPERQAVTESHHATTRTGATACRCNTHTYTVVLDSDHVSVCWRETLARSVVCTRRMSETTSFPRLSPCALRGSSLPQGSHVRNSKRAAVRFRSRWWHFSEIAVC